jgi:DNA-binding transcriptional ArsR family regulator
MTLRRFQGSYDLDKVAPADLPRLVKALAAMDALAALGLITFEVKIARPHKVCPEPSGRLQPQRQRIVDAITGERWWTAREVSDALGMNRNSINAQLGALANLGLVEASSRQTGADERGRGVRAEVRVFRASDAPSSVDENDPTGLR